MDASQTYTVDLTNFNGPLDLLLTLIEKRQFEVTEVSVGRVTGDYLRTLSRLETADERELHWFLDVATRLLGYKSRALAQLMSQSDVVGDGEDESADLADLTEQLRQLQLVRQWAGSLQVGYGQGYAAPGDVSLQRRLPPPNLSSSALVGCWQALMARQEERAQLPVHQVTIARLDIGGARDRLVAMLSERLTARVALEAGSTRQRVERLLALLDMIKHELVEVMTEGDTQYVTARS